MKVVALGSVCEINPTAPRDLHLAASCSFVPMDAVDDCLGTIASPVIRPIAEVAAGSYTYFADGDVLFAKITPCMENGKCAVAHQLVGGIGFGSTEFHVLRANRTILPKWIYYFLRQKNIRKQAERTMTGSAGQKRVPARFLEDVPIPLPPLPEQQRIAAILERADRLRRLRRYALALSEGYLQAVFVEMFGDPMRNPKGWEIGRVGDVLDSSQYGTSQKSNSEQRGYPVLGMGNITYSGSLDLTSLAYVDLIKAEFQSLRLQPGDIIFNRTNSTELVGKTAYWNLTTDAVIASYLVKLRLKQAVRPEYFVALLNAPFFKHLFRTRCKEAIGQSNVSPTLLAEFPMMIPPVAIQQEFAKMVGQLERLRAQQREALRQAEQLFAALLARAFRETL